MITENLSTLKIHKLTQEQYERELEAGRIDPSALYLTPEEDSPNIYIQNEEPVDVEDGSLWVDMDAEGTISGSGGNVLIVNLTVDESSMYGSLVASHSASEIKAYLESGSTVIGRLNNSDLLLCMTNEDWGDSENYVGFLSSGLNGGENYYYKVRDDKSVYRVKYTHRHSEYIQSVNGVKPDSNGNVEITIPGSGGNVDLTGYATEEWVQEGYQPKGEYLTEVPEGYATETFVTEKIAEAELGGGGDGLVIQSKNLINPDEITEGYYIATNGELAAAETVKITGYIEVKPNTNYVYSHNSTKYDGAVDYGLYDSDKNFLEHHTETQNITTTENTAYVRISVPKGRANMQFEEGTSATAYEPYYKWVNPEYVNALTKEESAEEIARIDAEILSLKIPGMPTADIPELIELYLTGLDPTRDVSVTQLRKNYNDGSKYLTTLRVAYSDAPSTMIANFAFSSEEPIAWAGKMVIPLNAYYSTVSGYACIDFDALTDNTSYWKAVQVDKSKITDISKLPHIQNYRLEQDKCSGIVKLNKDVEHLVAHASKSRSNEFDDTLVPLEFVHFTDVHAQTNPWSRVCDYIDEYENYIQFALHTGDYVGSSIESHIDLYGMRKPLNRPILNACGNHDLYLSDSNMTPDGVTQAQTHAIICSDTSGWGVTFGTEANAMYYYRDFAESGIRLVVLDDHHWTEAQATWLTDVLTSAKTNSLAVITASHMVTAKITERVDCSFTPADDYSAHRTFATQAIDGQIKTFKDGGGVHVCHLSGHYHFDDIGYTNSDVLNVICECATPANAHTETVRVKGMKSYDCFNVVSVDVNTNRLKIVRIGNNSNASLKAKNVLCYDYAAKKVIANW